MRTKNCRWCLFVVLLFTGLFQLEAAESGKTSASVQESWETISNRWGSVLLENIKQSAKTNEITAQYYLAIQYSKGNGVSKDEVEAYKWMKLAAGQGMARAQRRLAWMYEDGTGVDQDYGEAVKFLRLAAAQGDALAQNNLGWLYKIWKGLANDPFEAVKWFQKAAQQGEKTAAENLAWMYKDGSGIERNFELAEQWMGKSVNLEEAEGKYKMAIFLCKVADAESDLYHRDTNRFPDGGITNEEQYKGTTRYFSAAEWFKKSAEQGSDKADYELAYMYHVGKLGNDQRSNCIPWFLKAAELGNAPAQSEVGQLQRFYPNNALLKSVDPVKTLLRGAESGNFDAQFQLAKRYQSGDGVTKDPIKCYSWMRKASQNAETSSSVQGDALYCLAMMYEKGEGVQQDFLQAKNLFIQAAEGFSQSDAEYRVGQMYEKGEGLPQDDYLAARSYFLAIAAFAGREYKFQAMERLLELYDGGRGVSKTTKTPDDYEDTVIGSTNKSALLVNLRGMIKTPKAQLYAGKIYYEGKLVPKNLADAAAWIQLAANQKLDEAILMSNQIKAELSPSQKDEAIKLQADLEFRIRITP